MKKISLLTLWMALSFMGYSQTIIYVRALASGSGSSWSDACDLATAMTLAQASASSGTPTEVWVKSGTYYPSKTVEIADMVKVYGGFDGSESKLSQRNYARNATVIDAQKGFGVMTLGMNAVLNGFTIQNGSAHAPDRRSGGGVWMKELAKVENCYLLNNQALDYGGAIYADGNGLVVNSVFAKNQSTLDGVAIYGSSLEVRNNTITNNALMHVTSNTDVSTPVEICSGSRATLSVLDAGTYRWSSGETSAQITTAVLTAPTTYTVTVMPHDQSSVFELKFEVRVKAQPQLTISTNKSTANVGDTLVFTAHASPLGGSYRWDNLSSSTDSVIKQDMQALGDLTYSCTYSLNGCVATATANVANSRCMAPTAPDDLRTYQSSICIGDSVRLQLQGGFRNSGSWELYAHSCGGTKIDSNKSSSPLFQVKPTSTTTYYVRGEGCGEQTACVSVTISVNALPSMIMGLDSVCQNVDVQLTSITSGGSWTNNTSGLADISAGGLVTTKQPGIATFRYTLPATGCYREHKLTILAAPQYISGLDAFCAGTTTTYDAGLRKGGVFRVEPTTYASIDVAAGVLTSSVDAPSDHKVKVYYAEPQHGCESYKEVNVYQKPLPIAGSTSVCEGDTLLLSNATTPAGLWLSGNSMVGDFVGSNSGEFAARTAGKALLSYVLGNCSDTLWVTVHPRPIAPILGKKLCEGSMIPVSVSEFFSDGRWSVNPSTVASVDSSSPTTARLTGLSHGSFTLTYTLPTGCYSRLSDSVYRLPTTIVGDSLLGLHKEDTLKSGPAGGFWQSSDNSVITVQTVDSHVLMEAVGVGKSTLTYTLPNSGCSVSKKITVASCASITPPAASLTQQALCGGVAILPIHYTFAYASKISLSWTDNLGQAIAQPTGLLLDTTTTPNKATLSGNIMLPGVYHYKLKTVDHFGGCLKGDSVQGSLRIFQELHGGNIGSDQSICQGTTPAAFNNIKPASGGAPGGTYLWQRQPVSSSSWQNLPSSNSLSFDDPSLITESHRYRRQYSNACGVVYSDTVVVQIDSLPLVTSATIDSNTSCAGGNGKITLALKNPSDVVMSIDGSNFQSSPVFSALAAGTYTIDLRNTQSSCESEFTVEMKNTNKSVPQLKITGRDSICSGDSALWRVTIVNNDGTSYRQRWSRQGNANLGNADSVWLKGLGSSYEVEVTHEATSCVASLSRGLKVMPPVVITEFSYFGQGDTVLCENEALRFKVGATSSGLPRTYAWHRAQDPNFTVGNTLVSTSSEFNYAASTARIRYYKAVVSSPYGICPSVSSPVIKVTSLERPKPAIAGPGAVCSGDRAVLSVSPQSGWTYRWLLGSDTLSKTYELDVLPLTSSNLYVLQAHNGYCQDQSTHTVDLLARPTFSYADVNSGATVQSVCHNGSIQEIRVKVENATGLVLVWLGTPLGLSFDGTAMKLSGSVAAAAGTYPYLCYTTGQASECAADTAKGAITILSPLDAGSVQVPSFICYNSIPSQFANQVGASGGASGGSYQWRESTDGSTWSDIAGATDQSIQVSTPLTQTMYYRRMYTNACGDVYTTPQQIQLWALPAKPTLVVVDNTKCSGGSNGNITVDSPLGVNYEYNIQSNANFSDNPIFSTLVEDVYRIYVRDKSNGCQSSDTARIRNMAAASNVPEFNILTNLSGNTDSVCSSNSAVTFTAQKLANCSGAIYRWVKASDTNTTLSTTDSYTAPSVADGEHYVLRIKNDGGCDAVRWRTMTLVEPLTITAQPQSDTACGAVRASTFSIAVGNVRGRSLRYQWQRRTTASGSAWQNVGSSSNTYSTIPSNKDTAFYFQCLVQVQNSAICPTLVSNQVHMQMLSTPQPKFSGDSVLCRGSSTTLSVPSVYKSYAWMLTGSPIAGATSPALTTTPSAASQIYTIFVNNGFCEGGNGVTVKTVESPSISMPIPAEQNLCYNTTITARRIVVRHATGLAALDWKRDGSSVAQLASVAFDKVAQGKTAAGVDTCVYELSGSFATAGTYTYTMTTTGHASMCPAATLTATLIVNSPVDGGAIETASTEACFNMVAQPMTNKKDGSGGYGVQGDGVSKYQWYSDANGFMDAVSGATTLSYNPADNYDSEELYNDRTYVRKYINQCGASESNTIEVRVKPLDDVPTLAIEHQTSCSATPNGKITVILPAGNDYEFSKSDGSIYQNSPVFSGLSAVTDLQVVARHKSTGCRTLTATVDILDKVEENRPVVTLKVYPKDSVCEGFNTVGIKASVTGGGLNPTLVWSDGLLNADSISVTAPSQANALRTTEYRLTVTNTQTGCLSASVASAHVYVFPPVVINQQPVGGVVCVDSMDNQVLHVRASHSSLPRSYQWERASTQAGPYSLIVGATSFDYSVPTDSPSDFWYRCRVAGGYGICGAVTSDAVRFQVLAKPKVPVVAPAEQYICDGASATLIAQNYDGGNSLRWSANAANASTESVSVSPAAIAGTPNAPYSYSVMASNGVCATTSAPAVVRVSRKHIISDVSNSSVHVQNICGGSDITSIEHNATGGAVGWTSIAWRHPNGNTTRPSWITGTLNGNELTLTGKTPLNVADTGVYHWKVYTVGGSNNVCPADTITGTILVGLVPTQALIFGAESGTSSACSDTLLTASGGTGGTLYFQGTTDKGTSLSTPSNSQLVSTSGDYYFRALSVHGCWGPSGQRKITIYKPPTITKHPSTSEKVLTLHSDSFATLEVDASGTGTLHYQWYRNTTASNSGGVAVASDIGKPQNYTPDKTAVGPYWYYCVISNECSSVTAVSGKHWVNCSNPTLAIDAEASRHQIIANDGCYNITPIRHTSSGAGSHTLSWSKSGSAAAPIGLTPIKWDLIGGTPKVASADTGTYIWTITATSLACVSTSSGSLKIVDALPRPILASNNEITIAGQLYVADHESNVYKTVQIGSQIWTTENMRCRTSPTNVAGWRKMQSGAAIYLPSYHEPTSPCFGMLYNWAATMNIRNGDTNFHPQANHRGICPSGWHVPTEEEWCLMETTLQASISCDSLWYRGTIASRLSANSSLWVSGNTQNVPGNYLNNGNQNSSGFNILPAGNYNSGFNDTHSTAFFWTSTPTNTTYARERYVYCHLVGIARLYTSKDFGFSVRCVKD